MEAYFISEALDNYYADNASRLRGMVNKILLNFGEIPDKSEFYSIANEVFCNVLKRYDGKQSFDGFLYSCILNKVKTEFTRRNRTKRSADRMAVSLELPVGPETDSETVGDMLASDFDLEKEIMDKYDAEDARIEKYLSHISVKARRILEMRLADKSAMEIRKKLGLTDREYRTYLGSLRSYEAVKNLLRDTECQDAQWEEKGMETISTAMTSEKTKNTGYAISAISKKLKTHRLRDDHVLQRSSGQWSNLYKSELISDILQGKALTPIIISEEIKDGITMHWLIDGKQRCTNIDEFLNDGFAISQKVQRYEIPYQADQLDEDGHVILNGDGFPVPENRTFDIRKKKFSQLPEELQDRFLEYQIPVMLNLNCTKKEIAYDIARFNRCRPMNVAQNGWTGLEEDFAEYVDNMLKMQFFMEGSVNSAYRDSNNRSGMMRRMIVESIMCINFLDSFHKDFRKMCEFLSEHANDSTFIEFYSLIERLSAVSNEKVSELFNIKDSFLWFTLFSRFTGVGMEDVHFVRFMEAFKAGLSHKEVDGISYAVLDEKSTKDKNIVTQKLNLLERLMNEFLQTGAGQSPDRIDVEAFIKENVDNKISGEDIALYEDILEGLIRKVKGASKLLEERNRPSLIAIVAYSFEEDVDLDEWIVEYFKSNSTYLTDQKENYLCMAEDLRLYTGRAVKKRE